MLNILLMNNTSNYIVPFGVVLTNTDTHQNKHTPELELHLNH